MVDKAFQACSLVWAVSVENRAAIREGAGHLSVTRKRYQGVISMNRRPTTPGIWFAKRSCWRNLILRFAIGL